jgi:hypothetical protein
MPANNARTAAAAAAMMVLFTAVIQGDPFVLMWKKARDKRLRARRALEAQRVRGPRHRVERPCRGRCWLFFVGWFLLALGTVLCICLHRGASYDVFNMSSL